MKYNIYYDGKHGSSVTNKTITIKDSNITNGHTIAAAHTQLATANTVLSGNTLTISGKNTNVTINSAGGQTVSGIPTYGIRACAKVRDDRQELTRVAQELLIINLVMSAISYVALFAAIAWVPRLQREKPLYVIISLTILLTSIGMEWLYKALEQYTYITVRSVAFKLVALAAMYVGFCIVGVAGMILLPLAVLVVKQLHDGGFVGLWR